jgi:predicted acylesterase/phospholipase RssA
MERQMGRPIHESFDMIAGTSAGGLLAMMMGSLHKSAAEVVDIWKEAAPTLFSGGKISNNFRMAKSGYARPGENFERSLAGFFSSETLARSLKSETTPKVFVPATLGTKGVTQHEYLFRSYELDDTDGSLSSKPGTCNVSLLEAARATAAAPTYFPLQKIEIDGTTHHFRDGGLVANNPSRLAIVEALRAFPGCTLGSLVSIGTGRNPASEGFSDGVKRFLTEEGPGILTRTEDADNDVRCMLQLAEGGGLLQDLHYYRFQYDLPRSFALDDVNELDNLEHFASAKARGEHVCRVCPTSTTEGDVLTSDACLLYESVLRR